MPVPPHYGGLIMGMRSQGLNRSLTGALIILFVTHDTHRRTDTPYGGQPQPMVGQMWEHAIWMAAAKDFRKENVKSIHGLNQQCRNACSPDSHHKTAPPALS